MLTTTVIGPATSQARLINLDGTLTVLADPGWNGTDSLDFYTQEIINSIDIILLSQTSVHYIGAYVKLLIDHPSLKSVPAYSTLPVSRFGRIAVCELYRTCGLLGPVVDNLIELADLTNIFNAVKPLNYAQTVHLSHLGNKPTNLSLTAYNSGYSIGGSIWLLESNNNDRIVYAPVWNHAKDTFLNSCNLFTNSRLHRPTCFITNCDYSTSKLPHPQRVTLFLDTLQETIKNGIHALIPTSLTGRFFDLVLPLILHRNINAKIYLVNYTGLENMKTLANFIEWMNSNLSNIWDNEAQSQIVLENNRITPIAYNDVHTLDLKTPHIFFTEDLDLIPGAALTQLLIDFHAKKTAAAVVLTEKPNANSQMNRLFTKWRTSVDNEGDLVTIDVPKLKLVTVSEKPLRGQELAKYEKDIEERREKARVEKEGEGDGDGDGDGDGEGEGEGDMNGDGAGDVDGDDDDDEEGEGEKPQQQQPSAATSADILSLPRDFNVSSLKHKHRVFPFVNNKLTVDEYGIVISHDDFKVFDDDRFPVEEITTLPQEPKVKRRKIEQNVAHYLDALTNPLSRTTKKTTITIKCGFAFVDLAGVHDLRSLKFAAQQIKPRRVVILPQVHGGDQDQLMSELAQETQRDVLSRAAVQTEYIRCPLNETITLSDVVTSYELTLDTQLAADLRWKLLNNEYSVSYVAGTVQKNNDTEYTLHGSGTPPGPAATKIGDIKLTQLRRSLASMHHRVELLGDGRLVIDDEVIVVKSDEGHLLLQGTLNRLFYKVKSVVENMLATI